jgi:hypothetical protein
MTEIGSREPRLTAVGKRYADHVTPSIREKLALNLPKSGGRLRTKVTDLTSALDGGK